MSKLIAKIKRLAYLCFVCSHFTSCNSIESEPSFKTIEAKIIAQQQSIDSLRYLNKRLVMALTATNMRIDASNASNTTSSQGSVSRQIQTLEERLDRDENVINRIGHRATDAYNQSSMPFNPR